MSNPLGSSQTLGFLFRGDPAVYHASCSLRLVAPFPEEPVVAFNGINPSQLAVQRRYHHVSGEAGIPGYLQLELVRCR